MAPVAILPPLIAHPSPNHGPRRGAAPIDTLILHYTGMRNRDEALARLCDPSAEVSAHYVIDEDGTVFQLVDEERRAWHAGLSFWQGERDLNSRSIGIELVNPGHEHGYRRFPPVQMQALIALVGPMLRRRAIPPSRILGHSDVAPWRKQDPGELFDWQALAASGIGLWPQETHEDNAVLDSQQALALLCRIGYEPPPPAMELEAAYRGLVLAFQRHWVPSSLGRGLDAATNAALCGLARCG
jgi:N-acetylmuramoyl-L-alanine amidase